MRYPAPLQPGGTVGFIAPSFGCTTEPYASLFTAAKERIRAMGCGIAEGPNCRRDDGIGKSSSPEACGAEINAFFTGEACDAILSCGGGETMCEDLEYVDFAAIRQARPRWFMGYSDNTNLTFTLPVLCDTAAIYGPNGADFGMRRWHTSLQDAFDLLAGRKYILENYDGWEGEKRDTESDPLTPYRITEPFRPVLFGGKTAADFSGRLIGGCLDCLQVLCGTKYDRTAEFAERYGADGIIWFLESCDLNPMGIRRALWQLDQAGWFAHVSGFLIGRPLHFGEEMMGLDTYEACTGILSKYGVPIVMDADLGHLPPRMPLIAGAMARITADEARIRVRMELT